MDLKKLQKVIDTFNSYYSFALVLYAFVLYTAAHSHVFLFIAIALTPVLTGWGGYLIHGYLSNRNLKHGFKLISNVMNYELLGNNKYLLSFKTDIEAEASRMMTYPIGYQWSGSGDGAVPQLADPKQKLIGVVKEASNEGRSASVMPYKETVSSEGDWNYWFVGFDHALYPGEKAQIRYSQLFEDKQRIAKPCIYYLVNTPMKRLELNVKFPANALPKTVTSSYFKLEDRRHAHTCEGVQYDPEKQWASWVIENPKYGYSYRIDWQ
jgi:hypothetical protein